MTAAGWFFFARAHAIKIGAFEEDAREELWNADLPWDAMASPII
jgi:hypothetical protein